MRGTQDCRASWGLCVAWDSLTLRSLGVVMHCMGLAHTSSLSCREKSVGGGGCLECAVVWAARRTPTTWLWLRLHQFAPLPVSRNNLVPTNMRRLTAAKNDMPIPAVVSLRNNMVFHVVVARAPGNNPVATRLRHCEPQEQPRKLAPLRASGNNPGPHQHGRTFPTPWHQLSPKQHFPTTCWLNLNLALL